MSKPEFIELTSEQKAELSGAWFLRVECPDCGADNSISCDQLQPWSAKTCLAEIECRRCGAQKTIAVPHPANG